MNFPRAGAFAAIVGGSVRAVASFAPDVIASELWRQSLYAFVDACLALGLVAFYSSRSARRGAWGTTGLAVALVGIVTVRANRLVSTADLYAAGAFAIACGVMILTIRAWFARAIHGWVPAGFTIALLIGIVGTAVQGANALFVCSGVVFGVAFAGLGVETWASAD